MRRVTPSTTQVGRFFCLMLRVDLSRAAGSREGRAGGSTVGVSVGAGVAVGAVVGSDVRVAAGMTVAAGSLVAVATAGGVTGDAVGGATWLHAARDRISSSMSMGLILIILIFLIVFNSSVVS